MSYLKANPNNNLEQFLEAIKQKKDEHRLRQVIDLYFYLQELFFWVDDRFGKNPVNNYQILLNKLLDSSPNGAVVVSFNYDSLFEKNFFKQPTSIDDYIKGKIKLIKPHGSWEWVYKINFKCEKPDLRDYLVRKTEAFEAIQLSPENITYRSQRRVKKYFVSDDNKDQFYFPAIVIPTPQKDFVCPRAHVEMLEQSLSSINKVLILGWRAGDLSLLNLLNEKLDKNTKIHIVLSSKDSSRKLGEELTLKKILPGFNIVPSNYPGFGSFISSDEAENFFNR